MPLREPSFGAGWEEFPGFVRLWRIPFRTESDKILVCAVQALILRTEECLCCTALHLPSLSAASESCAAMYAITTFPISQGQAAMHLGAFPPCRTALPPTRFSTLSVPMRSSMPDARLDVDRLWPQKSRQ